MYIIMKSLGVFVQKKNPRSKVVIHPIPSSLYNAPSCLLSQFNTLRLSYLLSSHYLHAWRALGVIVC